MDDERIGADQARRLRVALVVAELELSQVWMHYFRLGGNVSVLEIEAYLHHALTLPALQRDLLARALTELTEGHRISPLPFTADYPCPAGPFEEGAESHPDPADRGEPEH